MSRTLAGQTVASRARTPVRMTEGQKITELVRAHSFEVKLAIIRDPTPSDRQQLIISTLLTEKPFSIR